MLRLLVTHYAGAAGQAMAYVLAAQLDGIIAGQTDPVTARMMRYPAGRDVAIMGAVIEVVSGLEDEPTGDLTNKARRVMSRLRRMPRFLAADRPEVDDPSLDVVSINAGIQLIVIPYVYGAKRPARVDIADELDLLIKQGDNTGVMKLLAKFASYDTAVPQALTFGAAPLLNVDAFLARVRLISTSVPTLLARALMTLGLLGTTFFTAPYEHYPFKQKSLYWAYAEHLRGLHVDDA